MKSIMLALSFCFFLSEAHAADLDKAVFGAGCFWCVEAIYEQQPGVTDVVSGYAGGTKENPTYEEVSSGLTGHAEVVEVTFDPEKTSYEKLVDFFWKTHDPTDPRGVWPDFGRQYRSIILPRNEAQREAAERSKKKAQKDFKKPIVTEIVLLDRFYPAEKYHQDFVRKNPEQGYVRRITIPKLKKLGLKVPGN